MTKLFTTIAVMQIVEQGKWKLDDDMRPIVPCLNMPILRGFDEDDKPILEENTRPITLRYFILSNCNLDDVAN